MKILTLICCALFASLEWAEASDARTTAASSVNAFAVAHYRLSPGGNMLTSPWSIETALAMTFAGASGKTLDAMRKACFFPENEAALHNSFRSLREAILTKPGDGIPFDVRMANRIFSDRSVEFLPGWSTLTRTNYAAEAGTVDFRNNREGARDQINEWVSEQTNRKITGIIPTGALDKFTRLVLVNAVYFDVPWDERFTKELTTDQPFHLDATHVKTVPLMFKQHRLRHAKKDGFQIVALPYAGGTFQFVVILPDAVDGLAKVETLLTGELLNECARLNLEEVRLSLPRLKMEPPIISLRQSLTALGAGIMFDEQSPGFARMADETKEPLYVSDVFHRTFIELDEDGTKAAAATASVMRAANGVPHAIPHQVVKADHPFAFMIQHIPSGACLFLGRLADPAPAEKAVPASSAMKAAK